MKETAQVINAFGSFYTKILNKFSKAYKQISDSIEIAGQEFLESVIGCSQTTTAFGLFQEEEEGEFYQPSDTSDVSLEGVEALTEILASEIHIKIISELK